MKHNVNKNEKIEIVTGKYPSEIDVSVLLIFFNRPQKLQAVFEQVKKARPSKLYLYQDGAREGRSDDIDNVIACRKVVSDIDWTCEIHQYYSEVNHGCDPSEYIAQKWMFETEEMGIVLEDDDIPSLSLFKFFRELLIRYKDDQRIAIICGMNNFDVENKCDSSYFFSKRGSIWGWASWKRFIDLWDGDYSWIGNSQKEEKIRNYCDNGLSFDSYYKTACIHKSTKKEHYESIMFAAAAQNNMFNIVPKYNMISNIGIDSESTHSVSDIRLLCFRVQKLLYKKTYEMNFPLIHPTEVIQNVNFDKKFIVRWYQRYWDKFETIFRRILFTGHIRN